MSAMSMHPIIRSITDAGAVRLHSFVCVSVTALTGMFTKRRMIFAVIYDNTELRMRNSRYSRTLISHFFIMGRICIITQIPPKEIAAETRGIPPSSEAADIPVVISENAPKTSRRVLFFIKERTIPENAENKRIHVHTEIIPFDDEYADSTSDDDNSTVAQESVFPVCEFFFSRENAIPVKREAIQTETSITIPAAGEPSVISPAAVTINAGPAFTQKDSMCFASVREIFLFS